MVKTSAHLSLSAAPWGPDVDEYSHIDDVGYMRKEVPAQHQFEELELLWQTPSEYQSESGLAELGPGALSGGMRSGAAFSGRGTCTDEDIAAEEDEEGPSSSGEGDEGAGVASLSDADALDRTHTEDTHASFHSPASSTIDFSCPSLCMPPAAASNHPGLAAARRSTGSASPAASMHLSPPSPTGYTTAAGATTPAAGDPTWDQGPQDIKLVEPVTTPNKKSGDQRHVAGDAQRGAERACLSRVESLSSSLKDFDHERLSGGRSGFQSDTEREAEVGEVIDFNPIPLAEATPQDLQAIGLRQRLQRQLHTSLATDEAASSHAAQPSSLRVGASSGASEPSERGGVAGGASSTTELGGRSSQRTHALAGQMEEAEEEQQQQQRHRQLDTRWVAVL